MVKAFAHVQWCPTSSTTLATPLVHSICSWAPNFIWRQQSNLKPELSRAHALHDIPQCAIADRANVCNYILWLNNPYLNWAWAYAIEIACMHNAVLGVVNRRDRSKSTISSIHGPRLALRSKELRVVTVFSTSLTTTTAHMTPTSRFTDFLWTMTTTTTLTVSSFHCYTLLTVWRLCQVGHSGGISLYCTNAQQFHV